MYPRIVNFSRGFKNFECNMRDFEQSGGPRFRPNYAAKKKKEEINLLKWFFSNLFGEEGLRIQGSVF